MYSVIKGCISYIETSKAAGTPEELMTKVVQHRINNVKNMIGKSSPSLDDMTGAIQLVGEIGRAHV